MCGIAGIVSIGGARPEALRSAIGAMVDALRHRGPDGSGHAEWVAEDGAPAVGLGHTRLAVIDLSEAGAQPMRSPRRRIWITYNGEVYNYVELRRELEGLGRTFTSASDTEVVLQAYEEWGVDLVSHLRGMFAFAIWDAEAQRLTLARDRFGIKPLYVHHSAAGCVFGSEIRSLLASGRVPARLDREALDLYLRYQTVPTPGTLVEGVSMIPPGTVVTVAADGTTAAHVYWDLLEQARPQRVCDRREAVGEVRRRLREAVDLHMVSDVPVGVFLSGGIDSSALASLVRTTGHTPRTFAVTMGSTPLDESRHARAVATAVGAEHTEIPLSEAAMLETLPAALEAVDHPSGDGINTFVVSQAVRQTGIKVALSGLGGDEVFAGYPSFRRLGRLPAFAGLWRYAPGLVRRVTAAAVRGVGRGSVSTSKTASILEGGASLPEVFPVLREVFSRAERQALLGGQSRAVDPYAELLATAAANHQGDVSALVSFAEARTYMHDVLLRDTDQMSMRHALEVRVPLLDHQLAEYVVALPGDLKLEEGRQKPLLVDALDPPLPVDATRRPKQGFVLPFDDWMRGPLREYCEASLGASGLSGRGLVDDGAVSGVWRRFLDRDGSTTWARSWTLVALEAWLQRTGVSS